MALVRAGLRRLRSLKERILGLNRFFSGCPAVKEDVCGKTEANDNLCAKEEKKLDPCTKKKKDPCAKEVKDPCEKQESDPCAKEEKKKDPCAKEEKKDPCAKQEKDPCAKEEKKKDPCAKEEKEDPCDKPEQKDPCSKKEEKKDDPCTKNKEKDDSGIKKDENDELCDQLKNPSVLQDAVRVAAAKMTAAGCDPCSGATEIKMSASACDVGGKSGESKGGKSSGTGHRYPVDDSIESCIKAMKEAKCRKLQEAARKALEKQKEKCDKKT